MNCDKKLVNDDTLNPDVLNSVDNFYNWSKITNLKTCYSASQVFDLGYNAELGKNPLNSEYKKIAKKKKKNSLWNRIFKSRLLAKIKKILFKLFLLGVDPNDEHEAKKGYLASLLARVSRLWRIIIVDILFAVPIKLFAKIKSIFLYQVNDNNWQRSNQVVEGSRKATTEEVIDGQYFQLNRLQYANYEPLVNAIPTMLQCVNTDYESSRSLDTFVQSMESAHERNRQALPKNGTEDYNLGLPVGNVQKASSNVLFIEIKASYEINIK